MAYYKLMDYPTASKTKTAIAAVFFSLLIFGAGFYYGNVHEQEYGNNANTITPPPQISEDIDFNTFWEAWEVLNEKYVPLDNATSSTSSPETTNEQRVWGAISGMTQSLGDPYTVFLPPSENEVFEGNIQGQFGGVGMEVGIRDNVITVISPLPDTPAAAAGVKPGDRILSIDGENAQNMSVQEAVQLIRGEIGTDVILTVLSEDSQEPREVTITRDTIQIPTIETSVQDNTFVVELYNFSAQSPELFRDAMEEFTRSNTNKLVLDLRGNAGGFLQAAVSVSSWFVDSGKVIVREDFGDKREPRVHRSKGYDLLSDDVEIVVLINGGTASAAEIVAGALQDHGMATLVGTQTFGKGSVQELVELTDNTSIKVTVARWMTPEGTSISEGGLTPDIQVEQPETADDEIGEDGLDVQLERAIELLAQ